MVDLEFLESKLVQEERRLERRLGEAKSVIERAKATKAEAKSLQEFITSADEAIGILNSFADARQAEIQRKVESIVSHGLTTIFDDDLSFHIESSTRGKLAATEFMIRSKQGEEVVETSVMDARGGGVAAVVGFLLRLVVLLLRPDARRILFLDETFAQLSAEYEPRLAEFLQELAERTGTQLVLVTHSTAYTEAADVVYRFAQKNGVTEIERVV